QDDPFEALEAARRARPSRAGVRAGTYLPGGGGERDPPPLPSRLRGAAALPRRERVHDPRGQRLLALGWHLRGLSDLTSRAGGGRPRALRPRPGRPAPGAAPPRPGGTRSSPPPAGPPVSSAAGATMPASR